MFKRLKFHLLWLLVISITVVSAQGVCSDLVSEAMDAVDDFCTDLGRNQACYGNVQLNAESQPGVEDFSFDATGDIVDVADILTLQLNPMNLDDGTWGVAVMSLQADIPNTLPGQNVTFVLFGDVYIENAASEEQNPMQAFYLRTGIGDAACEEAPDSGLLIQTPDGVDEVAFNVNGVDVSVGSTVLFTAGKKNDDDENLVMTASVVEGTANPEINDENFPAIAGTEIEIPLNQELLPQGLPNLPQPYGEGQFNPLPINPLPRGIDIAPPLPNAGLINLHEQFEIGGLPCGVEGLPDCGNMPPGIQNGKMPPINEWGVQFVPGVNCEPFIADDGGAEDPPPTESSEDLPPCPPSERANRPNHVDPLALFPDGDHDKDAVLNAKDACPYIAGLEEFYGCPQKPSDRDNDGIPDRIDVCPNTAGLEEFQGCQEAPKDNDSDGDGIPNPIDFCPMRAGTPEFRGCPQAPKEQHDSDEDGIFDAFDKCPYVAGEEEFDGCAQDEQTRDNDGDGVPDAEDRCPQQRGRPESGGCPDANTDSDGDDIPDAEDRCPKDPGRQEFKGCPEELIKQDSDGDGIPDFDDRCPNFAGKPEYQGCPQAPPDNNTDTDGDGIPDLDDLCPKTAGLPSYKGCPAPNTKPNTSTDSDGDGIADPNDNCPNQGPSQWGLNANGCPNPPPDSDGDGVPDPNDACPKQGASQWGLNANGCPLPPPDSDGDGIADPNDACPKQGASQWGLSGNGCPLPPPDSDGDGIADPNDACPNQGPSQWGLSNNGCPIPPPDTDGDGIADPNDACPKQAGTKANNGCP